MSATINVTAKTLDGTFSMPAELPTDVTIGTFKGAAQAEILQTIIESVYLIVKELHQYQMVCQLIE